MTNTRMFLHTHIPVDFGGYSNPGEYKIIVQIYMYVMYMYVYIECNKIYFTSYFW